MASSALVPLLLATLAAAFVNVGDANAFLKASPALREERVSEEDVQTSLLAEVEGTFGAGSASSRVKQIETILAPMFKALPKNENGYLGHATVRYALHRLFVQRHGWSIKGLDTAGGHRNSTSSAGLLKEQVPTYIQDLFEQRLGGRGFGLHELGVLAATVEHLVHSETAKRLGDAFKVHGFLPTATMSEQEADELLDTYMTSYILGEDLSNMTLRDALELKAEMPEVYMAWNETKEFVHATRRNTTQSDSTIDQKTSGMLDFALVARAAERVGERFGGFQDQECRQIKAALVKMEEPGTGRVPLADFYKPAVDGHWQFQESLSYLRQLGAVDESNPDKPRVIIANYVSSPSNCIASSSFYSVCCMDECEGLLGHLEREIAAPEASAERIAKVVTQLSSSTPAQMSPFLALRLEEIASEHGGTVPLHGRLFAQWMHHVFPRDCPYPHLSGTTNPQTPDEWLASTGEESTASEKEMWLQVAKADQIAAKQTQQDVEDVALPWSPEEELLLYRSTPVRQAAGSGMSPMVRNIALLFSVMSMAFGLVQSSKGSKPSKKGGVEKYLV